MTVHLEHHKMVMPLQQCNNYQQLHKMASALYSRDQNSTVRLFFEDAHGRRTEMESDDDLMALKYMLKGTNVIFHV